MLWAEHDPLFPIAWADRLNDWFTAAELRIVPNSGHFLPLEAPDAFARAVLERLQ
jgi:pimeloyl-ACP methyl ester carboxylesterase